MKDKGELKINFEIGLVPLTIIFIILKIFGVVTWSWLWVLSPLWLGPVIGISMIVGIFLFVFCISILIVILDG